MYNGKEQWVNCHGHDFYYLVSDLGRFKRKSDGKIIKPIKKSSGINTLEIFLKNNKGISGKKSPRTLIYKSFNPSFDTNKRLFSKDGDIKNLNLSNIGVYESEKPIKKPRIPKTNSELILLEIKKTNKLLKQLLNEK